MNRTLILGLSAASTSLATGAERVELNRVELKEAGRISFISRDRAMGEGKSDKLRLRSGMNQRIRAVLR